MSCNPADGLPPARICRGGQGTFLPFDWESALKDDHRAILYLVALLWTFFGVQLYAEVFMGAIDRITSKRTAVKDATGASKMVKVWNPTVANLTLMAMGSSAPEILLNVVGIFPDYRSKDLGPSTIVGSAAFNLLVITAGSIVVIPDGETRKIQCYAVFAVTTSFSIFAYLWLLFVLTVSTANVVSVFEAAATFSFFWILVVVAYLVDSREDSRTPGGGRLEDPVEKFQSLGQSFGQSIPLDVFHSMPSEHGEADSQQSDSIPRLQYRKETSCDLEAERELNIRNRYGRHRNLQDNEISLLYAYMYPEHLSQAQYRSRGVQAIMAGRMTIKGKSRYEMGATLAKVILMETMAISARQSEWYATVARVSFKREIHNVLESAGCVAMVVQVNGTISAPIRVQFATRDGSAKAGENFIAQKGQLSFDAEHTEDIVQVKILINEEMKETSEFFVDLCAPEPHLANEYSIGRYGTSTVVMIHENAVQAASDSETLKNYGFGREQSEQYPGILTFQQVRAEVLVTGPAAEVELAVTRNSGTFGKVSCQYSTKSHSAIAGQDYEAVSGRLTFQHMDTEARLKIKIHPQEYGESVQDFRVVLHDATGGARLGEYPSITVVLIVPEDREMDGGSWREQLVAIMYVGGSAESHSEASGMGRFLHIITWPFQLTAAFIPPKGYCDGWLCFFVSLFCIGLITALIGDLAELLGCVMDISDQTTAITLVALGTSLPDAFASWMAAVQEPTADSSIGNVTGSNAVNVFLGLGLPWTMAATYWAFFSGCPPGQDSFVVHSGGLANSVLVYSICAVLAIGVLVARRRFIGAELGGPRGIARASAAVFLFLWCVYIGASILWQESPGKTAA